MLTKFFKNSSSDIGNLLFIMMYKEFSGFFFSSSFVPGIFLLLVRCQSHQLPMSLDRPAFCTGLGERAFGGWSSAKWGHLEAVKEQIDGVQKLSQSKVRAFRSCHRATWRVLEATKVQKGGVQRLLKRKLRTFKAIAMKVVALGGYPSAKCCSQQTRAKPGASLKQPCH